MKNLLCVAITIGMVVALGHEQASARGFGGMAGGFHGGGFHGGGISGGFHGGSFHAGGFHPSIGSIHAPSMPRPLNLSGLDGRTLPNFSNLNSRNIYSGLRSSGVRDNLLDSGNFDRGDLDRGSLDRSGLQNFSGRVSPNRTQLNHFLGLPSDAGLQALGSTHTINGYTIHHGSAHGPAGGKVHGTSIVGPQGGKIAHGGIRGPGGNVAHGSTWHGAYNDGHVGYHVGFRHVSPSSRYSQAVVVRRGFHSWSVYTPGWYRRYPGAWFAAGWAAGYAWRAATWPTVYGWFDYPYLAPVYYDYGTNIVYENNNVYVNGENAGTSAQYYNTANQLATAGTEAKAPQKADWLPLGVFAVSREDNSKTNMMMQIAVNKAGIIRGNYTDTLTGSTEELHGSVDKKTQRAAWTIGDNTSTVIETGLYNLTKDEAPALVHFGKDRTEQWLLVRVKQNEKPAASQ